MTRSLGLFVAIAVIFLSPWALHPLHAQSRDNTAITRLDTDSPEAYAFFNAIGIYDFLRIVSEESILGADQIRVEFFPDLAPEIWDTEMRTLYDVEALVLSFEAAWQDEALGPEARAEILAFYDSAFGQDIVAAEIAAREGMADPDIAEAARAAVEMARNDNDPRLQRFADFSADLGLADRNVASMLNAQFQFLTGLSDGGALQPPMAEADILRFIAGQTSAIQAEAFDWLEAYQLMAYGSFSAEDFQRFADLNTTGAGQALASAVFSAFDTTFNDLQYNLGLRAAHFAAGDDI